MDEEAKDDANQNTQKLNGKTQAKIVIPSAATGKIRKVDCIAEEEETKTSNNIYGMGY